MKTVSGIITITIKVLLPFLFMNLAFSCANSKDKPGAEAGSQDATANETTAESITITGTVKAITFGKDGYTADVQTETEGVYAALVSMVNLGGREKYQSCEVGNSVSLKGVPSELGGVRQLKVEEIISISASEIQNLDAKYREIKPDTYCWQTNKEMNLHTEPNSASKVEGRHFQGELLQVLGTKIVDNQLWVNVTYKLKVKAGYEDQFADGQVMSTGSPTGWIGGAETPVIECK